MLRLCALMCAILFFALPNVEASPATRAAVRATRLNTKATEMQARASVVQAKAQGCQCGCGRKHCRCSENQQSQATTVMTAQRSTTAEPATLGESAPSWPPRGELTPKPDGYVAGGATPAKLSASVFDTSSGKPVTMELVGDEKYLLQFHDAWQSILWPDWRDHLDKSTGAQIKRDLASIQEGAKKGRTYYSVQGKVMQEAFDKALAEVNK